MAEPARKINDNLQRQPHIEESAGLRKVHYTGLPSPSPEARALVSRIVLTLVICFCMIAGSVGVYSFIHSKNNDMDKTISNVEKDLKLAGDEYDTRMSMIEKSITPEKIADLAKSIGWIKIPDSSKIDASSSEKNSVILPHN